MKCPGCETSDLKVRTRDGVEIDVCPRCRGVWLDRGELEKLIARAVKDDDEDRDHDEDGDDDDAGERDVDRRDTSGDDRRPKPAERGADDDEQPTRGRRRRWYHAFGDLFD